VIALLLFLGWLATRGWVIFRSAAGRADTLAQASLIAILLLLLHSIVDYPLRTYAHLALFGMLCALLVEPVRSMALGKGSGGKSSGKEDVVPFDHSTDAGDRAKPRRLREKSQ
jgi:hypothetical protein